MGWNPLLGIALWALLPGFIAKHKGRSFWGYYFLSFLVTPLTTTLAALIVSDLSKSGNTAARREPALYIPAGPQIKQVSVEEGEKMSIPRKVTLSCPGCGMRFETTIFESLNTEFAPDVAETVVNGERFSAKCPSCGFVARLEYDLLYHDMRHDAMIWVIHKQGEDYQKRLEEIMASPWPLSYHTLRFVSSMGELREKAACLETGKDDRVVELCKLLLENELHKQHPEFSIQRVFYTCLQGKPSVIFYDGAGRKLTCPLDEHVYAGMSQRFERVRSQTAPSWQIIDHAWAIVALENVLNEDPAQPDVESHREPMEEENAENERAELEREQPPKVLYCRKCGEALQADSLYCGYCGTKVIF